MNGVTVNIAGKSFNLNQAHVNNLTDVELAKFCADSSDPMIRELAYRLGSARKWNPDDKANHHDQRATIGG